MKKAWPKKNREGAAGTARRIVWTILLLSTLPLFWNCDYARMREDDAVEVYKTRMAEMPKNVMPVNGGTALLKTLNPASLKNPLPPNEETVARGKVNYGYFCEQCHGTDTTGKGTVGQSFAPLPTSLIGEKVQKQSDGEIFMKTSLGYKRHPPLAYTVDEEDRWAIITYIRFLGKLQEGGKQS